MTSIPPGPDGPPGAGGVDLVRRAAERSRRLVASDPELQLLRPSEDASTAIRACATSIDCIAKAFEQFAARPCLGQRAVTGEADGHHAPRFSTARYADVWGRVQAFASGLAHGGLAAPGRFVGILGFGDVDWVVADLSCVHASAVSVPLQAGTSPDDLRRIIDETALRCVVCGAEELDGVESVLGGCSSIAAVVVMDPRDGDSEAQARLERFERLHRSGLVVRRMSDVEADGRRRGLVPPTPPSARGEADPLMTLYYTSGSTGTPKGAMVRESLLHRQWQAPLFDAFTGPLAAAPFVTVSYMPLNHAAGRGNLMQSIRRGGLTHFAAKSDMSTLFDDIRLARPTTLFLAPRVADTIYQRFRREVLRRAGGSASAEARARAAHEVMKEMRFSVLGDRLLLITTGSAPTPPEVARFLRECFEVPVLDFYGSTEAGLITTDDRVSPEVTWKLVDVPELGYRSTDQPYPRGALRVKSPALVPGYYRNEQASKALFDEEGFLDTGDIVEQRGPDRLVWIDRARNVLKLSQGEFVATSRLEGTFAASSPFIRQIFLYGNPVRAYLLAVIVPDLDAIAARLGDAEVADDDARVKQLLRAELGRAARENHLQSWEVPRDFIVEREPFTPENGLMTASKKPALAKLRARYGPELEALYASIEEASAEELARLPGDLAGRGTAEKVRRAVAATLGLGDRELSGAQSFVDLGGDSIAAANLGGVLQELTGVHVPVGRILDSTSGVRELVDYVERAASGAAGAAVTSESIHGRSATSLRAEDLRIERFLSADEIARAGRAPRGELPPRAEAALLTGANGFLGRFLTLELLERLGAAGARLYALVRAPDDAAAAARLARGYRTDPALSARFLDATAGGRLVVLAGDLMKPGLGLTDEARARLSGEVDLIVHNGALVNHALGYEQLFEPNVLGTVEVIRLALTGRRKAVSYVSTAAVLAGTGDGDALREEESLAALCPERPTEAGYAAGYAATKWASELLLRDAHQRLDLDVAVFRPSEIMAHSQYRSQINVPDHFTRLLIGLVETGIAPRSFYTEGAPDEARHYDGQPVDQVARSIAALSIHRLPRRFSETFHVVNPHREDGISLDVITAWVRSAGYRLEAMADYDLWIRSFRERLEALPEPARSRSPLAILGAWARADDGQRPGLDASHLLERLRDISEDLGDLPHVSEDAIHKALRDLVELGILEPAPASARAATG